MKKHLFNVDVAFKRLRKVVRPYPKAAMFELAQAGHSSLFEQLVGCIISIRTMDEVSLPVALRLLAKARSPKTMTQMVLNAQTLP